MAVCRPDSRDGVTEWHGCSPAVVVTAVRETEGRRGEFPKSVGRVDENRLAASGVNEVREFGGMRRSNERCEARPWRSGSGRVFGGCVT
jgi:hypothetical protein